MRATPTVATTLAALLLLCSGRCALPVSIVVDTTDDVVDENDGATSLREAILLANQHPGESNVIALTAGTYTLSITGAVEAQALSGDLDIRTQVTIQGAGATNTILDGAGIDRVVDVAASGIAILCDLTIRGGAATLGAGLANRGVLILERCCVRDNAASFYGGAIEQFDGVLWIRRSCVVANTGGGSGAGGIDVIGGVVELLDSTVSQNSSRYGAGLYHENGSVFLIFSTIAGNSAEDRGGGIFSGGGPGTLYLANTLVGDNAAPSSPDVYGVINSQGYNLIEDASGCGGLTGMDSSGIDPGLLLLAFNGGATATHALEAGSPAINRGDPYAEVTADDTDQRGDGYPRRRGICVDIGAFEFPEPDEDGDGIPDEWEMQYGLNPTNAGDAVEDEDGDKAHNLEEYVADTVPTNDASYQSIAAIELDTGQTLITFRSTPSRQYQLQGSDSFRSPIWANIGSATQGQPHQTTVADADSSAMRQYRVAVRKP